MDQIAAEILHQHALPPYSKYLLGFVTPSNDNFGGKVNVGR